MVNKSDKAIKEGHATHKEVVDSDMKNCIDNMSQTDESETHGMITKKTNILVKQTKKYHSNLRLIKLKFKT